MANQNEYDLIVIGTGTAGSTVAYQCSAKGWKVAIIDYDAFGGTCALRGCEPKKVLNEAAKVIDSNRKHVDKGIYDSKEIQIRWGDLIRFKRTFTDSFPKEREESYNKNKIVSFHGKAKFISQNELVVLQNSIIKDSTNNSSISSSNVILYGKYILIATGAQPIDLNIVGSSYITTSDKFLEYAHDKLPNEIVFIGGGYISFEFAHIAAFAGSKVTILHRGKQPLEHFDSDLVNLIIEKSKSLGINIRLQTAVKKIEKIQIPSSTTLSSETIKNKGDINSNNKFLVYVSTTLDDIDNENANLDQLTFQADMVVHGAGRMPNIHQLDLEKAGVEYSPRGIKVNDYLQSVSNPCVYAAGDVVDNGGLQLTPVASYDGEVVFSNLLNGNIDKTNYNGLPSVAFTIPAIASVGLNEKDAKERGLKYRVNYQDTSGWYSSRRVGETCSGFKVLVDKESDKIIGAHLVGPHAEEVINIFSLAIRLGICIKDLKNPLLYAYPTNSSDIIYML